MLFFAINVLPVNVLGFYNYQPSFHYIGGWLNVWRHTLAPRPTSWPLIYQISSQGSAYLIKMERLKGALEIVAVCNRKNKLLQLWSERLALSTAHSLITSNDGMLQTDFKKLLNKFWETNACNCVIYAQGWTSLGDILHSPQHCQNIRRALPQPCAGIGEGGGVSCAACPRTASHQQHGGAAWLLL